MRGKGFRAGLLVMSAVLVLTAGFAAAGVRVPLEKVPPPAVKAVKDRYTKAEIRFVDKETNNRYEFALQEGGRKFDVGVTGEGKVMYEKEEIQAKDVPAAVKDAVRKQFPGAEITEGEKVSTGELNAARIVYELLLKTGKETKNVTFAADGKQVANPD